MAVRFGQTLFGGAAGYVTAAGVAVCLATASGHINRIQHVSGSATGVTQAEAVVTKTVLASPSTVACVANATGAPTTFYYTGGSAEAEAQVVGASQVAFSGYGWAYIYATSSTQPVRRVRGRGYAAVVVALGEAEGQVSQIGYASPAVATAMGFGTTYYVGRGTALAEGSITATARHQMGGYGQAVATCTTDSTEALHQIGGAGIGEGVCTLFGEPAVTRAGVLYLEPNTLAVCTAEAVLTHSVITQSQTGNCTAVLEGTGWFTLGGKGHALATATGWADPIAASTAVTAIVGDSASSATGRCRLLAGGKGTGVGTSIATGSALVKQTRHTPNPALTQATGSGSAIVKNTKVWPDTAYAVAAGVARINRIIVGAPVSPTSYAGVSGKCEKTIKGYGVAVATATGLGTSYRTTKGFPGAASAAAAWVNYVEYALRTIAADAAANGTAQIKRIQYGQGTLLATALGYGANQVNDLVRAPASRTLSVTAQVRTTSVITSSRIITV